MTPSEQARADAVPYWCCACEFEISAATRWWHVSAGHATVGPMARDSRQIRTDALADAETLRRVVWDLSERRLVARFLSRAANYAYRGLDALAGRGGYAGALEADHAFRGAARAAFKAVPGLRGDR